MISLQCWDIMMRPAHKDAAAPFSCIWRIPITRPTEGCVAISRQHMLMLLARLGPGDELLIE